MSPCSDNHFWGKQLVRSSSRNQLPRQTHKALLGLGSGVENGGAAEPRFGIQHSLEQHSLNVLKLNAKDASAS